jgi:hypothetical protein
MPKTPHEEGNDFPLLNPEFVREVVALVNAGARFHLVLLLGLDLRLNLTGKCPRAV